VTAAKGIVGFLPKPGNGTVDSADPFVLRALVFALTVSVIGFFLPWYHVSYTPPHGSYTLNRHVFTAFRYTYSGISSEHGGLLQFSLGSYTFGEQVISGAAMTSIIRWALIGVLITTLLSVPALAGLTSNAVRLLQTKFAKLAIAGGRSVALVIEAMGAASFLLLGIGLAGFGMRSTVAQALGDTPAALQAASYLHISLGDGFWLVLIGLLIIVGSVAKQFFATLAVLIVGVIVLSYVHVAPISSFVHQLGF